MAKLYSIGETAKIMGLSVQTLRNYTRFPFLKPAYINEETGYRYFTFDQFHIIDRIKYLRGMNLSLAQIEAVMSDGHDVDKMIEYLEMRQEELDEEMQRLRQQQDNLEWYTAYFKYTREGSGFVTPHISTYESRYGLLTYCNEGESVEDIEVRLAKVKNRLESSGVKFHRQFAYLLNYDDISEKCWKPCGYFIYISNIGECEEILEREDVLELPAGNYACLPFHLRHLEELNVNLLREYIEHDKKNEVRHIAVANEYEDNLVSYHTCPYELQVLI